MKTPKNPPNPPVTPKRRGRPPKLRLENFTAENPATVSRAKRQAPALVTVNGKPIEAMDKPKTRVRGAINPLTGLTDKQEAFVQAVANGKNLSDAYRLAYVAGGMADCTIWANASRLLSDSRVTARLIAVNEQKEHERRIMAVSRAERVLERLEKLADSAETGAVKVRALELLGKTAGLFTDKVEVTENKEQNADDIEKRIAERLSRLGLTR